jgi:hypothetical protein
MFDKLLAREGESLEEYQARFEKRENLPYQKLSTIVEKGVVEKLYGFSPDLIAVFFSKKGLPFWHGGVTWVREDGTPIVQLQKKFATEKAFFGYPLEEVAVHEALHAFRADFSGDRFEEILAYQSSKSLLRRRLGPLFRFSWEPWVFLCTLIPPWFTLFGYFFPFGFLAWRWIRLKRDDRLFKAALASLQEIFLTENPLHILVRMSEEEILLFAKGEKEDLRSYIEKQTSLRWQQIISSCY